jgi:hypothetical protein
MNTRSGNTTDGFDLVVFSSGAVRASYASTVLFTSSTGVVQINNWYHVAVVRNGSIWNFYLDGVSLGSITNSSNFTSTTMNVGCLAQAASPFVGNISNFRYVNGTAVYTSNFTPSTVPLTAIIGTQFLTAQSLTIIDNSTNNFAITTTGSPTVSLTSPFIYQIATAYLPIGASGYVLLSDGTQPYWASGYSGGGGGGGESGYSGISGFSGQAGEGDTTDAVNNSFALSYFLNI